MKMHLSHNLKSFLIAAVAIAGMSAAATAAHAGGVKYQDGDKWLEIGGRIQLQYHQVDPDDGDSEDDLFFRRLRPYIKGSVHPDWYGKFQFDYGKAEDDNEMAIKDAYLAYTGFKNVKIRVGNAGFPFSREYLTSSKSQQLVERTFVGDHNYGTPDRNAGVHLTGNAMDKHLTWGFSGAVAHIDPDAKKLDFDTPVNRNKDFNEGYIVGGRVDYHPFGYLKMAQGDFDKELKATIGVAAFTWSNDDDNNTYTDANDISTSASKPDVDKVTGVEISGALRYMGVSVDAQYNLFNAETIDSNFTGGIYEDGETDLENWAVEGGYMLPNNMFEIVAGYQVQDADNYEEEWTRTSFGANYFVTKNHDIKLQATYRIGENIDGIEDNDADEIFVQAQYVF
jgi:hypothetical protein